MPGTFISDGIINAQEGITIGDLKLIAPKSAVASFGFDLIENRTDLAFKYTVDYAPNGLDPNSTAVGKAVGNTIQAAEQHLSLQFHGRADLCPGDHQRAQLPLPPALWCHLRRLPPSRSRHRSGLPS